MPLLLRHEVVVYQVLTECGEFLFHVCVISDGKTFEQVVGYAVFLGGFGNFCVANGFGFLGFEVSVFFFKWRWIRNLLIR